MLSTNQIVSPEQIDEQSDFLHVDSKSKDLKLIEKSFGWHGQKMGEVK